mmetsp:Transcript_9567/g.20260  ORF Transcript_9567/g.20260 Transcript_9567/m.20260 type:complete len:353 (-) Transcript_9567:5-1063(-)
MNFLGFQARNPCSHPPSTNTRVQIFLLLHGRQFRRSGVMPPPAPGQLLVAVPHDLREAAVRELVEAEVRLVAPERRAQQRLTERPVTDEERRGRGIGGGRRSSFAAAVAVGAGRAIHRSGVIFRGRRRRRGRPRGGCGGVRAHHLPNARRPFPNLHDRQPPLHHDVARISDLPGAVRVRELGHQVGLVPPLPAVEVDLSKVGQDPFRGGEDAGAGQLPDDGKGFPGPGQGGNVRGGEDGPHRASDDAGKRRGGHLGGLGPPPLGESRGVRRSLDASGGVGVRLAVAEDVVPVRGGRGGRSRGRGGGEGAREGRPAGATDGRCGEEDQAERRLHRRARCRAVVRSDRGLARAD